MRFGSLFSGIGGFDLGLERAGMAPTWQVEIDPKCREVLRRHWPNVPHHEDVTQVGGGDLGAVDLICGGFPCQDLSVAGRRAGLAGERSGLFYEFMRIVEEVAPRWVLIENVPGLLSSNGGRDMGAVLGVLGDLGYGYAWRILDSQYFGVPQRRRRVFIVGRAGGVCPPEVLFEPESLPGDSPPCRETGARVAATVAASTPSQRNGGSDPVADHFVAAALRSAHGGPDDNRAQAGHLVCGALTSASERSGYRLGDDELSQLIVEGDSAASTPDLPRLRAGCGRAGEAAILAHTLRGEGHDASEDGTGRGAPIVAFQPKASASQSMNPSEVCPAIGTTKEPAVAFHHAGYGASVGEQSATLQASDARLSNQVHGVIDHAIPRRLTPRECERLQAFPDDWTRYDSEGREIADSPRYRMLGNAVTVSAAEWIGARIAAQDRV